MILDIKNVSLWLDGFYILRNIDWTVKAGENWAIIGLNGSGKTSILKMITGYLYPSEGKMTVLGKKFSRVDLRELRKSIGWVSSSLQEALHTSDTVEEIILSGKFASIGLYEKPSDGDVIKASGLLEQFELSGFKDRVYYSLSQGEKQKVIVARALMCSPKLLILDEPCAGLDIFARENFLSMIAQITEINNPPALLYVSHHIEEIEPVFEYTLLLKEGKVHSAGRTKDILNKSNLQNFYGRNVEAGWEKGRPWIKT